jgi:hypothetical protein
MIGNGFLFKLAVKGRDLTVALPMFYFMTIDELPCVFLCGLIVGNTNPTAVLP